MVLNGIESAAAARYCKFEEDNCYSDLCRDDYCVVLNGDPSLIEESKLAAEGLSTPTLSGARCLGRCAVAEL